MRRSPLLLHVLLAVSACGGIALAQGGQSEWPQWRGPQRDGVSRETGLLKSWPQEGPGLLWTATGLGYGWTTPTVAGGQIYGAGFKEGSEVVWAVDAGSGKLTWSAEFSRPTNPDPNGRGIGPRGSVTVDGSRLYVLGVNGDLACLNRADGKLIWSKKLTTDFGGNAPGWGYSESPLIVGDNVVVTPGGRTATLAALNKNTGETAWKAVVELARADYSSAILADVQGVRQVIQFLKSGVVGVGAADGKVLWQFPHAAGNTANCPTPIYHDGHVFATAGYGRGAGLAKLSRSGDAWTAEGIYNSQDMVNHHGGVVLYDGHLYGIHDRAGLSCLEFKSGAVKWADRRVPKGSVVLADGHIYARSESTGQMTLVEATPAGYTEKGRLTPEREADQPPARPANMAWAHPVVAGGRLILRDQGSMRAYDIRAK